MFYISSLKKSPTQSESGFFYLIAYYLIATRVDCAETMTLLERLLLEAERLLVDLAAAVLVDLVLRLACRVTVLLDSDLVFDLLAVRVVLAARKGT